MWKQTGGRTGRSKDDVLGHIPAATRASDADTETGPRQSGIPDTFRAV